MAEATRIFGQGQLLPYCPNIFHFWLLLKILKLEDKKLAILCEFEEILKGEIICNLDSKGTLWWLDLVVVAVEDAGHRVGHGRIGVEMGGPRCCRIVGSTEIWNLHRISFFFAFFRKILIFSHTFFIKI